MIPPVVDVYCINCLNCSAKAVNKKKKPSSGYDIYIYITTASKRKCNIICMQFVVHNRVLKVYWINSTSNRNRSNCNFFFSFGFLKKTEFNIDPKRFISLKHTRVFSVNIFILNEIFLHTGFVFIFTKSNTFEFKRKVCVQSVCRTLHSSSVRFFFVLPLVFDRWTRTVFRFNVWNFFNGSTHRAMQYYVNNFLWKRSGFVYTRSFFVSQYNGITSARQQLSAVHDVRATCGWPPTEY